ncbi:MAG TPA: TSUP family transporter, partial [Verrucomicrobiae bacterium]|nr:TSUP family transporter [Verrucomicrobiae bacterium]
MQLEPAPAIPLWALPLLFLTGLVAGFVDSIAGGGGLITVPVLLCFPIPRQFALGTNKLQATFGSGSAAWHYAQMDIVKPRECLAGVIFTVIGAAAGTLFVQSLSDQLLRRVIPIALLAIATYMIFKPKFGAQDGHARLSTKWFYPLAGLTLGFYDGFLGPGTGSFWAVAFILGLGFNLVKATGYTKVMNFASNLTSLAVFAIGGRMYYAAGLTMGVGQLLGARAGSRMVA